ncbi:formin-like protein 6 [Panicum virgatum]|uniref:formin-like protein 6 n=1 Tax=Panicum virgatum TaxID=38727 RepID=UPI0019D52E14|nr:formin-like protein 6 [Panicum virgatum]
MERGPGPPHTAGEDTATPLVEGASGRICWTRAAATPPRCSSRGVLAAPPQPAWLPSLPARLALHALLVPPPCWARTPSLRRSSNSSGRRALPAPPHAAVLLGPRAWPPPDLCLHRPRASPVRHALPVPPQAAALLGLHARPPLDPCLHWSSAAPCRRALPAPPQAAGSVPPPAKRCAGLLRPSSVAASRRRGCWRHVEGGRRLGLLDEVDVFIYAWVWAGLNGLVG